MNNLNATKKKLTITFTLIVFIVVFLLWFIFLATKYYNELRIEKNNFSTITFWIRQNFDSIYKLVQNINPPVPVFNNRREKNRINNWIINWVWKGEMNFLIINKNDD